MRSTFIFYVAGATFALFWSSLSAQVTVGVFDPGKPTMTQVENQDLMGSNLRYFDLKPGETCQTCIDECMKDPNCKAYTFTKPGFQASNGRCYLKSSVPSASANKNCISGIKKYAIELNKEDQNQGEPILSKLDNQNIPGGDYKSFEAKYWDINANEPCQQCIDSCLRDPKCKAYTWVKPGVQGKYAKCWLKTSATSFVNDNNCISGVKSFSLIKPGNVSDLGKPFMSKQEFDNLPGSDYKNIEVKPGESYQIYVDECLNDPKCRAITYVKPGVQGPNGKVWFKSAVPKPIYDEKCISWVKNYSSKEKPKPEVVFTTDKTPVLAWSPYAGPAVKSAVNLPGSDYKSFFIPADQYQFPFVCQKACLDDPKCNSWTYVAPGKQGNRASCWLKTNIPVPQKQDSCISGIKLQISLSNLKPVQKLNEVDTIEFMKQLNIFDSKWKSIMTSTIGNFNKNYFQYRAKEIISQKKLLEKCAYQQLMPAALPDPIPNPSYQMEMKNGMVTAKLKNNPAININLNSSSVPAALPQPIPNPGLLMDFSNGTVIATYKGKTIKSVPVKGTPIIKLPNVTSIQTLTTDPTYLKYLKGQYSTIVAAGTFTVYDNSYIIIYGKNFGEIRDTCGVRVGYEVMSLKEFSDEPAKHYDVDLIPYGGSWKKAWFDDFIIAFLPAIPGAVEGNKSITIWMGGADSYKITIGIDIQKSHPGIASIQYAPNNNSLYDNATFWIYGSGFEATQNGKEIYIESNKKRYPVSGSLSFDKWSENVIVAKAPDFLLDTIEDAKLIIHDSKTPERDAALPIQIGPLMTYVWISGEKFANLQTPDQADEAHRENKTISDNTMNVLAVSHYPGCGNALTSGNNTDDWYFRNFPDKPINREMPRYFRFNDFFFFPMDPQLSKSWDDYLIEYGQMAIEAYSCPECFVVKKFVELLCHLFDPGMGKYDLKVDEYPTFNKPSTAIHFNNTCTGDYDGYPNKYLIAFQLYGPQKYVSELEYDSESINKLVEQFFGPQK